MTKLRKKSEIIDTLAKAINKSDKEHVKKIYTCHGSLVKNGFKSEANPAEYAGWARLENGDVIRIEAEPREHENGKISLSLKVVTIPNELAVELDLDEPQIPDYTSNETRDFLNQ